MASAAPHLDFDDDGSWIVARRTKDRGGEASGGDGGRALRDALTSLEPPSEVVNLKITASRNGKGLSNAVACEFPVRLGYESAVSLGVEGTHLFDLDVEIAKKPTVTDPSVALILDGMAFIVRVRRALDGSHEVELRGAVSLLREELQFDARAQSFSNITERFYDRLQVNESLRIGAGGDGTLTLGNTSSSDQAGALKLKIQVR